MWRYKVDDMDLITMFIDDLSLFKNLKDVRWERVDEEVQRANPPATHFEDWITPPDEEESLRKLEKDPDYVRLRGRLARTVPELKKIADFLSFNAHHDFDWVRFTTPLIGNEALEDGLSMARQLLKACERHNYTWGNVSSFFKNWIKRSKV
jgi:hypothetical protein